MIATGRRVSGLSANNRYHPAVELARLILRATSFDLSHGGVRSSAFLVDMNLVFEDFAVNADLYQLLAYTIAAGLPGGLLIYAAGEGDPAIHEVVNIGKQLEVVTLDLAGTPDEVLGQVREVAARIAQSHPARAKTPSQVSA